MLEGGGFIINFNPKPDEEVAMRGAMGWLGVGMMMVALGCTPQGEPSTSEPEQPAGLENGSFTAELNGFQIHYEVHGSGPVLMVLTNSWGFNVGGLRGVLGGLEEGLTMVYFDPRGMGGSGPITQESDMGLAAVRADFDALRRHLGLDKVNALGWSNGAGNLIYLAAEYPETLDAAIFLHGTASFTEEDMAELAAAYPEMMQQWQEYMQMAADPEVPDENKTAAMRELWLDKWFPVSAADPEAARAMLAEAFRDAELNWAHAAYANQETPVFDARDKLPLITARSLVITGTHDTLPVAKAEELNAGLADSELLIFESSGHFSPLEEPERFKSAVFDFLETE